MGILALSFALGAAVILLLGWLIIHMPEDYFVLREGREHPLKKAGKNLLGIIVVGIGISLMVLPGPGILTILMGLMLIDFPGKKRVLQRAVRHRALFHLLNRLREKAGKPPLRAP